MAKCTFLRRSRGHSAEVSTAGPTTFTAITALHTTARGGGRELRWPLPGGGETRCGRLEPGWVEERGEVSESDESQRFHS